MKLVGVHRSMTFAEPMRELWHEFRQRAAEVEDRASHDFVSMRIFAEPVGNAPVRGSRFEQWAAVEVTGRADVPDGMALHSMGGGTYAVFRYRGRADGFEEVARHIYGTWLPSSPYELDEREFFEILGPSYEPNDPSASEDIWIPVRPRNGDRDG